MARQLDELRRRRTKATRQLQQRLYDGSRRVDTQPVVVWFADDSCEQLDVSLDITPLELLYLLADLVQLDYPELFALCELPLGALPRHHAPCWLPMLSPLSSLSLRYATHRLHCRLRYLRRPVGKLYTDSLFNKLYFMQTMQCVVGGEWRVEEEVAVRMAGVIKRVRENNSLLFFSYFSYFSYFSL